jgi:uncharacterized protein with HEPN domain
MRLDTLGALYDIQTSAHYIFEDTAGATYAIFLSDRRMRQLVERNFLIIGEAINRIRRREPETLARITATPAIVGLRNVLSHEYDVIDYEQIWQTVQESLPLLSQEVAELLREGDAALE